jgi:predicted site-specific integrase-resolvase
MKQIDWLGSEFLSETEAAARLGVSRWTLRRWRREGTGPRHLKYPGTNRVQYDVEDIDTFIEDSIKTKS